MGMKNFFGLHFPFDPYFIVGGRAIPRDLKTEEQIPLASVLMCNFFSSILYGDLSQVVQILFDIEPFIVHPG